MKKQANALMVHHNWARTWSWVVGMTMASVLFGISFTGLAFIESIYDHVASGLTFSWMLPSMICIVLVLIMLTSDIMGNIRMKEALGMVGSVIFYMHPAVILWSIGLPDVDQTAQFSAAVAALSIAPIIPLLGLIPFLRRSVKFYSGYYRYVKMDLEPHWTSKRIIFKFLYTIVGVAWPASLLIGGRPLDFAEPGYIGLAWFSWVILILDVWFPSLLYHKIEVGNDQFPGMIKFWFALLFTTFSFVDKDETYVDWFTAAAVLSFLTMILFHHVVLRNIAIRHQLLTVSISEQVGVDEEGNPLPVKKSGWFWRIVKFMKLILVKAAYWIWNFSLQILKFIGSLLIDEAAMYTILFVGFQVILIASGKKVVEVETDMIGPFKHGYDLAMDFKTTVTDHFGEADANTIKALAIAFPSARGSIWDFVNGMMRVKQVLALIYQTFSVEASSSHGAAESLAILMMIAIPMIVSLLPLTRLWEEFNWIAEKSVVWAGAMLVTLINLIIFSTLMLAMKDKEIDLKFASISMNTKDGFYYLIIAQLLIVVGCFLLLVRNVFMIGRTLIRGHKQRVGITVDEDPVAEKKKFRWCLIDTRNFSLSWKSFSILASLVALVLAFLAFQFSWFDVKASLSDGTQSQIRYIHASMVSTSLDLTAIDNQFGIPASVITDVISPITDEIEDIDGIGDILSPVVDAIEDVMEDAAAVQASVPRGAFFSAIPFWSSLVSHMQGIGNFMIPSFWVATPTLALDTLIFYVAMLVAAAGSAIATILLILHDHDLYNRVAQTLFLPVGYAAVILVAVLYFLKQIFEFKNSFIVIHVELGAGSYMMLASTMIVFLCLLLAAIEDPEVEKKRLRRQEENVMRFLEAKDRYDQEMLLHNQDHNSGL